MSMEDEIKKFSEFLQQQRDEINLKLHLGGMEAKEEMDKAEEVWAEFKEKIDEIGDETKETTIELVNAAQTVGDDLKSAYEKLVSRLT
ncbi:MAG TPA: hypothetical protein ENJ32_03290 [Crenotrichaceae bacterium]|nr:hypothetical protein [Crenotrichaceae bacterium]